MLETTQMSFNRKIDTENVVHLLSERLLKRQADFWVQGQPGLQSEFQDSQGYTGRYFPEKQTNKQTKKNKKTKTKQQQKQQQQNDSAIQNEDISFFFFSGKCMELENIILSEVTQTPKEIYMNIWYGM